MKTVLMILDGVGDRPIQSFGGKTPLEAAKKPVLDELAAQGVCGLLDPVGVGVRPGSEVGHLSIFGYDPCVYYPGRGPLEAVGAGIILSPKDVAMRANFGTVDESLNILDRRAGRIESSKPFTELLDGMVIDGVKFIVKAGVAHRAVVVMHGHNLSHRISEGDPHVVNEKVRDVVALEKNREAEFTARVVNKFLAKAHSLLKTHVLNKERAKKNLPQANYVLVRGPGQLPDVPSFQYKYGFDAACIAGGGVYKGIARLVGMNVLPVPGATATPDTDLHSKFKTALGALDSHDFVFLHIKATDLYGEDGNPEGKKKFIEKIDAAAKPLLKLKDALVVVTGDHSTPCALKAHSGDPVPIMFSGVGVRPDDVQVFGERACMNGGVGRIRGLDVMPEVMNLLGKTKIYGG